MAAQISNPNQPFYVVPQRSKHLDLVYVGENEYYTDKENTWEWKKAAIEFRIVLNAWFNTDIASIPGLFGLSKLLGFERDGLHRRAAVLHDMLYLVIKLYGGIIPAHIGRYEIKNPETGQWEPATTVWKRKDADAMFLHFMLLDGVTPWKARTMYQAVRTFGGIHMRAS
jgi:hypothetical protein